MKKTIVLSVSLLIGATLHASQVVEAVVARVGDRIITRTQYLERLNQGYEELARMAETNADLETRRAELRERLLDDMLSELLLKDRADRLGLSVSPDELKEAVQRLKVQYNLTTEEEFNESLRKSGLTRVEMEARLKDSLLTQKVFARELRSRSDLSDRELRERYEREKERFRRPERARVREIIVATTDRPQSVADASAKAVQLAARAKQGEDFAKLAAEFSDAPTKEQGGDLGEVAKGELLSALDQAVFGSNVTGIIGPIQTRSGFHVLKVEQRFASEIPSFDSVKTQLRKEAGDETFQRDYKAYLDRLRKEAFIQINQENIPKI